MKTKQSTAVFLGAGASRAFGYPQTAEIFPQVVREWSNNGELFEDLNGDLQDRADRIELRKLVKHIFPGLTRAGQVESLLITEVFSLVDHAVLNESAILPLLATDRMRRFRELLKQAIFDILIGTWLKLYDDDEDKNQEYSRLASRFARWLRNLPNLSIITTNYDTLVEDVLVHPDDAKAIARIPRTFDFGFDWRDTDKDVIHRRPTKPRFRLLKLHGSLNRLRCNLCQSTYINPDGSICHQALRPYVCDDNTCWCGHARLEMDIVAPSLVRQVRDPTLIQIWTQTMECLRQAHRWYLIGYSLPAEDYAIRDLLLRAYHSRRIRPKVTVVQLSDTARPNYELLVPKCDYHSGGLEVFLKGR